MTGGHPNVLHSAASIASALDDLFRARRASALALLRILDEEREALGNGDLAAMDTTAAEKIAALADLEQSKAEEAQLLAGLPFAGSDTPLEQALIWCDETGTLRAACDEVVQLMVDCDRNNRRNGLMVQQRLNYVRRAIDILHKAHADTLVYGPDGLARNAGHSRLLAEG